MGFGLKHAEYSGENVHMVMFLSDPNPGGEQLFDYLEPEPDEAAVLSVLYQEVEDGDTSGLVLRQASLLLVVRR